MQIILELQDLARLKPATRSALLNELGLTGALKAQPPNLGQDLLRHLNAKAAHALRLLANSGGSASWAKIKPKGKGLEPNRFAAAVHRRYRTATGDREAVVIQVEDRRTGTHFTLDPALAAQVRGS